MQIFRHTQEISLSCQNAVLAIGNFDGVHKGHQAIFTQTLARAKELGLKAGVLTFEPHPRQFFVPQGAPFRLTPFHTKSRLLARAGFDCLYCLRFDQRLASLSAEAFVEEILVKALKARQVVVGANFHFGNGREGSAERLRAFGIKYGFDVTSLRLLGSDQDSAISSTMVRAHLQNQDPMTAAHLLGHPFFITGRVARGKQQGTAFGYPTANLRLGDHLRPSFGIYAVRARILDPQGQRNSGWYQGVASLGINPMFTLPEPILEVHLFDFNGDLYGKRLDVALLSYLRGEEVFPSIAGLKAQMAEDTAQARRHLEAMRSAHAPLFAPLGDEPLL